MDNDKSKRQIGVSPHHIICTRKKAEEMGIDPFCECSQCKKLNRKQKKEEEEKEEL